MKIVYDHQIFAMQEYGGVSRYFAALANQLARRSDLELNLLAPLHFNRYLSGLDPHIATGLRVPKLPFSGRPIRSINSAFTRSWLKQHEPDIVHATYYFLLKKPHYNHSKVVVTVHDMVYELYSQDFPASDHTAQLKHDAIMRADHVICVSQNTLEDLVRITGISRDKVTVVHHGVNYIGWELKSGLQPMEAPYLLYVGQRDGYKNFSSLLNAYAECAELNSNLKLVCFGGGNYSTEEQAFHKHLGLDQGQVRWIGGGDVVLARLYTHATALVFPSLYEGFGMPPLEAMSFGCPVVCSNRGSIPEIVGDAGEYFDPENTGRMIEAIMRVTSNPSYADELRSKGNLQIKKYSWRRCAEETLDIYKSLL